MGINNQKTNSFEEAKAMFGSQNMSGGNSINVDTAQEGAMVSIEAIVTEVVVLRDKLPTINVFLPNGSFLTNVSWSGGYIDPATKNLHGDYIPPVVGQRVMVAFADGDIRNPYVTAIIFRSALSDDADLYVDYASKATIEKDSIMRSHRTGGRQHFHADAIETGYDNAANQKIEKEKISTSVKDGGGQSLTKESVTTGLLDGDTFKTKSKILQDASGITLGAGGPSGAQPVAVVNDNYVLTALGLQPILPAPTRTGLFEQVVKA